MTSAEVVIDWPDLMRLQSQPHTPCQILRKIFLSVPALPNREPQYAVQPEEFVFFFSGGEVFVDNPPGLENIRPGKTPSENVEFMF